MAISRDQKVAQVQTLKQKMSEASSLIFAQYIGLSVSEVSDLRSKLREGGAEMKVAKKTLIEIAAKEAGLPDIDSKTLEGPISVIFSFADPLTGAQIAFKFSKDHKQVALVGGVFDGKILGKREALELAKIPSRLVLLATFMGMVRSPLVKFAGICNSPLSGFARALDQLAEKGGLAPKTAAPVAAKEEVKATETAPEAPAAPSTDAPVETAPGETQPDA